MSNPVVALKDTFAIPQNQPFTGSVAPNDHAPANATWALTTGPAHGTVTAFGADGSFSYTPPNGFVGTDTFVYTLNDTGSTQSYSIGTVDLVVGAVQTTLKAWFNGKQVYLGFPAGYLVFDGFSFVRPQDAKFVAIVETDRAGPVLLPAPWPETQTLVQEALTWYNTWICEVIALDQTLITGTDVVSVIDPNNGVCVCGVSCMGTNLQYVKVTSA